MFGRKKTNKIEIIYDPFIQEPVLHCSICTGETVAGFKDKTTKKFTEVKLIRNAADLEDFKKTYHITGDIKKEY